MRKAPVFKQKKSFFSLWLPLLVVLASCQTPTRVADVDLRKEERLFSRVEYGGEIELKRSIIVDVRSRFEHEMSRPPRSFHAYYKDWDLSGYTGMDLQNKVLELQRLLSLKGIDPLVQVVILGKGLKGHGEEFLVASTLLALGIKKIRFMTEEQMKKSLTARGLPEIENVAAWSRPLQFHIGCLQEQKDGEPEILITENKKKARGLKPSEVFAEDLSIKERAYPKSLRLRIWSPGRFWAYGLALYFMDQGRMACVF